MMTGLEGFWLSRRRAGVRDGGRRCAGGADGGSAGLVGEVRYYAEL